MQYTDLNDFTRGYVDAIVFTECHIDNPELEDKTFMELAPETLTRIIKDCAGFDMLNRSVLDAAYQLNMTNGERYTPYQAGIDFWLTRNGHGAGFWDRDLGAVGDALADACGFDTSYPPIDLYLGDDNLLYLS